MLPTCLTWVQTPPQRDLVLPTCLRGVQTPPPRGLVLPTCLGGCRFPPERPGAPHVPQGSADSPPREAWCSPRASGGRQVTLEAGTEVTNVCKWVLALRLGLAGRKARRGRLVSRREEGAWRRAGASEPTHWRGTASAPAHVLKASLGESPHVGQAHVQRSQPPGSVGRSPGSPCKPPGPAPPPLGAHPERECAFPHSPRLYMLSCPNSWVTEESLWGHYK